MLKRLSAHLRSNVVAYVALFAALGGTGYAAKKIGTKQLKVNAVTKPKIAPDAIDGSKVQNASLTNADLASVNATQLGGQPSDAFGSGVVMGRIFTLAAGTGDQFGAPFGGSTANPAATERYNIVVPDQVISDFRITDASMVSVPGAGDNLNVDIRFQGTDLGGCTIGPSSFPGCSISTDLVIPDSGENTLSIQLQADDGAFYTGDDLLFTYRLTPAP